MFDTSTEEEGSYDGYGTDDSGSGATSYGQRPDVSEPEPHATLTHLYNEIHRIWHEENTGSMTEVTLHGLHGENSSTVTLDFSRWKDLPAIDPVWGGWLTQKDHFQVYLLHDQPQSVLPAAAHFLVEFTPRELELRHGKSPVVIERLEWADNGCPSVRWRATYVDPWELWHGVRAATSGVWWIGDHNILDPRARSVQAGSLLTFQPGHQPCLNGSLDKWPHVEQHLGSIIATRDCYPRRQYSLFVHAVGPDGNFIGTRCARVLREHLGMPHLLLQLAVDLWKHSEGRLVYLHEPKRQGELHFAFAQDPGNVHLCSIYARWPSGLETEWVIAKDTSDWDSLCLEGAVDGLQYNPFRHRQENQNQSQTPQGGINFKEVIHLWNWMDASSPIPSWTLPDDAWHTSTFPWITTEWWNYEEVDEIFIYTDGSANKLESSAAAVIFLRAGADWYYGGYLRHQLQGPPCAHRAELHGILLGYHWLNHSLKTHAVLYGRVPTVVFAFDATSAGYKAFGQWGGGQYSELVKSLRSIFNMLFPRSALWDHHWLFPRDGPRRRSRQWGGEYNRTKQGSARLLFHLGPLLWSKFPLGSSIGYGPSGNLSGQCTGKMESFTYQMVPLLFHLKTCLWPRTCPRQNLLKLQRQYPAGSLQPMSWRYSQDRRKAEN